MKNEILEGPLLRRIILFAIPLAASSTLQQLFNAADTAVVGHFAGKEAMAAVCSNSPLINLLLAVFIGLSIGANVVISRFIGLQEEDRISEAVHTSITLALLSGIFLLGAGQLIARRALQIMGSPEDVIDLATVYLRIYFLGAPAIMLYNFLSAILRSTGDSKRPMLAVTFAGIVNVCLNLLFVIVFHLSVVGVASATVIANYLGVCYLLQVLRHEKKPIRFYPDRLKIHAVHLAAILRIGVPAGIQGMIFSLANTVIQSSVNSFGSAAVAGSAAAFNLEIIGYYTVNAFDQAAVTFTSQNYAARKLDRCRQIYRYSMISAFLATFIFDMIVVLFRGQFIRIFTSDPSVIFYANQRILCVAMFHWMITSYEIAASCLRGMNYSLLPTILMVAGTCVFRIMWVMFFLPLHRSFSTLLYVYPASWVITGTLVLSAYFIVRKRALAE